MKEDSVRINHIIDSVEKIFSWISGVKKAEFMVDEKLQDAVIRRFEIIGEAAKNISSVLCFIQRFKESYNGVKAHLQGSFRRGSP